jgi:hypothetical protein
MKKIRAFLRRLTPRPAESPLEPKEDPAEALSDERVLRGAKRR